MQRKIKDISSAKWKKEAIREVWLSMGRPWTKLPQPHIPSRSANINVIQIIVGILIFLLALFLMFLNLAK